MTLKKLTLQESFKIVADNILYFIREIRLVVSSESSIRQSIQMKCQT